MQKDFQEMQFRLAHIEVQTPKIIKKKTHSLKSKVFIPPPIREEYKYWLPEDHDLAYMLSDLDCFYEFALERGYTMERIDRNQKLSDELWNRYWKFYNYPNERNNIS